MKKITLVLPALAAALLAVSACAKHDDVANNSATADINANDEIGAAGAGVDANGVDANAAGADPFANDAAGGTDNAAVAVGNAQ